MQGGGGGGGQHKIAYQFILKNEIKIESHQIVLVSVQPVRKQQVKRCQTPLFSYNMRQDILLRPLTVHTAVQLFPLIKGNSNSMLLNVGFSLHSVRSVVHAH